MDFMRTRVLRFKRDVPTQLMVRFLKNVLLLLTHNKDIVWDARFAECCRVNERGRFVLDYGKLDSIVPISRKSKHQHL